MSTVCLKKGSCYVKYRLIGIICGMTNKATSNITAYNLATTHTCTNEQHKHTYTLFTFIENCKILKHY